MCVCRHLTRIPNTVGVHVLQHPRERRHPLGTARLLRLGLTAVQVHVLDLRDRKTPVEPVSLPEGAGLLYPAPGARDLATIPAAERPRHLVVIDGTWNQAHRIRRDTPWISALPCFRYEPEHGSRYRIRTEPRFECLSTVESVVAALRVLDPDLEGTNTLLDAFDAMIDAQIEATERGRTKPRLKTARRTPPRPVPQVLRAAGARLVVVYAEAATKQMTAPGPAGPVRLSAVSLDGGRIFDRLVRTPFPPDGYLIERLGLEPDALEGAESTQEVLAAFREFCGPQPASVSPAPLQGDAPSGPAGPVLASWNAWTHHWLTANAGAAPCVLLKAVWANVSQRRVPHLDMVVQGLGLSAPELPVPGRAGRRLSHALAMARHILSGPEAAG